MNFSRTHLSFPGYRAPRLKLPEEKHTGVAFTISLLLHLLFLFLLASQHFSVSERVIEIELTSLPEPMQRERAAEPQIVAPPEIIKKVEQSEKPAFKSDVDSRTDVEQVKRGDSPDAGNPNPKSDSDAFRESRPEKVPQKSSEKQVKAPPPEKSAKEKQEKAGGAIKESHNTTPLKQLSLDSGTLMEKFSTSETKRTTEQSSNRMMDPSQYQAFSRPAGSGARFIGQRGTTDFLPNLPDGDITLLNTKADQFAVFVRRVATQVFGEIRNTGWQVLSAGDVNRVSQFSTFRAVLSLEGKLLRVEPLSGSGSPRFDSAIERAVKLGARDQNPPPAAVASDGTIHFIFQAKSWSTFTANTRSGMPMERRWLLLATGLE